MVHQIHFFFDDFINFQQCIIFDSTHDHTVQLIESHYFHPGKSLHIFPLALPMTFITSNFICSRLKMQCSDTNCEFSVSTTVTQWRGEKWKETKKSPICLNRLPPLYIIFFLWRPAVKPLDSEAYSELLYYVEELGKPYFWF